MQAKAWVNDSKTFLALRSSNYLAGQIAQRLGASIYCPGIGHIVSDPTVARTIMADQEHFSINEAGGLGSLISEIWGNAPTLLSMDGVEHHRVKFALLDSFKEEALSLSLGYELGQLTSVLISDLQAGKQVDIAQYIRIHTLHITSKLLGVEAVDEAKILYISDLVTNVMGCVDLKNKTFSKSNRQKARTYVQKLKVVAKEYYTCPNLTEGSLINKLKELGYTQEKTYGFIAMFLVAGTVTVSSSFPRLLALLIDTKSINTLREDPALLDSAINEGFRYITPGTTSLYGVKKSITLSGREFKENQRVIISLYNIMHNSRYTPNPYEFNISRVQNPQIQGLWFGTGPHFCMGSVLAKTEIKLLLTNLLALQGAIEIKSRTYRKAGVYPSYQSLTISLVPH